MADAGADGGRNRDCWRAGRTGLQVLEPKSARRHPVSTPSIRAPCLHPHANRVETVLFSSYKMQTVLSDVHMWPDSGSKSLCRPVRVPRSWSPVRVNEVSGGGE